MNHPYLLVDLNLLLILFTILASINLNGYACTKIVQNS